MIYPTGLGLAWIAVHFLGLAASLMVRMHLDTRFEGLVQYGFLFSLTIIALTTIIGYYACLQMWPVSAVTLSLMIVMAVLDLGSGRSMPANLEA